MSLNKCLKICRSHIFAVFLDQINLFADQIFTILQNEFGISINYLNDVRCLNIVASLKKIKQSNHVAHSTSEDASTISAYIDNLFLCEAVLAELPHELLDLIKLAKVEIRELKEDLIYFLLRNLMIQVEQELNFLDLLFKLMSAYQLRALEKGLHGLFFVDALAFHDLEKVLKFLSCFAENVGVSDH